MTDDTRTTLRGVFTALVTPFTEDGAAIDTKRINDAIRLQALAGVKGVVPCGTTGESPTLTEEEHEQVVTRVTRVAHENDLKVIAGAGSNSTAHAIKLQRIAAAAGADASLQVNPYYNRPSQEGLYRHFMAIADAADLPIVLYNIPGRTGVALTPETIVRLAAHPHIVAIKDATGGLDTAQRVIAETDLIVLSGDDPLTLPLASIGGSGVISVCSNVVPGRVAAMWAAIEANEWDRARTLHHDLMPLARGLLTLDTNPVPVKAALALLGRDSGVMRLPLVKPTDEIVRQIGDLLERAKLHHETGDATETPVVKPATA